MLRQRVIVWVSLALAILCAPASTAVQPAALVIGNDTYLGSNSTPKDFMKLANLGCNSCTMARLIREKGSEAMGGYEPNVYRAALRSEGQRVVDASRDKVRHTKGVANLRRLVARDPRVISAAFSPDGRRIVTASGDKLARVWDAQSGVELRRLAGHEDRVIGAVFSSDGRRIVTASEDKSARVWDAESGAELRRLAGHEDRVTSVGFSPDGRRIVTPQGQDGASMGHREWRRATSPGWP